LFLLDPASGERTRIATTDRWITAITWGPDGRSIAYVAEPGNGLEGAPVGHHDPTGVFVIRSGGAPYRVSAALGASGIDWSPDGRRIAFLRTPGGGQDRNALEFWVTGAEGRGQVRLARFGIWDDMRGPVWSPDSRLIAFGRSLRSADAISWFVAPADGSAVAEPTDRLKVQGWRQG
jgi:Tol biopolymer transport system component